MKVTHIRDMQTAPVTAGTNTEIQVLISADEGPHFAMRRFIMEPGGGMPKHTNTVEHEQYVLAGRARIGIGDEEFEVGPGNVVHIPAGVPHWYTSTGEVPFEFLCMVPNEPDTITIIE